MQKLASRCVVAAGIFLLAIACAESPVAIRSDALTPSTPSFGTATAFNNAGQCIGDDAVTWSELVLGVDPDGTSYQLNCTALDVDVDSIVPRQVLVAGTWVDFAPGDTVTCTEGSTITLRVNAKLNNSGPPRHDIGLWLATDGGDAISGACNHYNVPIDSLSGDAANLDTDACGDLNTGTTRIELGELTVKCQANLSGNNVAIPSCVAWSSELNTRECPVPSIAGPDGFRAGTLPSSVARCNCQPIPLIGILVTSAPPATGTLTIVKDANPNDAQDFSFTTTGTGISDFVLDDDADPTRSNQAVFSGLSAGTYTVTEATTPAFDLTGLSCTTGGASDIGNRNATVTITDSAQVTCTFTNTKRATVQVNKRENGALPLTQTWSFEIRTGASTSTAGTIVATGSAALASGVVNFSCSPNPNSSCENVSSVANLVPGNYQLCEVNMPAGWTNNISGFTPSGSPAEGSSGGADCTAVTLGAAGTGVPSGVPDPIDNVPPAVSGGSIMLQTGSFTLIGGQTSDALSGTFSIRNSSGGTQQVLVTNLSIVNATFKNGSNVVQAAVSGCVFSPLPVSIPAGGSQSFTVTGCQVTPSVRRDLTFTIRATINGGDQPFYERTYKVRTQ